MSVRDWIQTKKSGGTLTTEQVHALVAGVTDGTIADSQTASLLMAICLKGMTPEETAALTDAMLDSGRRLEWKAFGFPTVDKHSTGGVGDLISLPLAPAVAACGGHVPMISGRSLGHSGGTLDKLESIPGFRVDLSLDRLQELTADLGFAFGAATSDIAPADRHIYALRDATGTVESIPLITASILSKKAAEGLTGLVLDVKTGSGAFMVQLEDARALAHSLVETSARLGIHTVALITDMSKPLGRATAWRSPSPSRCWRVADLPMWLRSPSSWVARCCICAAAPVHPNRAPPGSAPACGTAPPWTSSGASSKRSAETPR